MSKYPNSEKLARLGLEYQTVLHFYEWLQNQGIVPMYEHETHGLVPDCRSNRSIAFKFLGIDEQAWKAETEAQFQEMKAAGKITSKLAQNDPPMSQKGTNP